MKEDSICSSSVTQIILRSHVMYSTGAEAQLRKQKEMRCYNHCYYSTADDDDVNGLDSVSRHSTLMWELAYLVEYDKVGHVDVG